MMKNKQKLALLPLMVAAAFACADDQVAQEEGGLQEVTVRADAKRVHAAKSYSIASDGDLRDRVNLGVLGKANAFTAPITVVNYDEKVVNDTEARTLVDVVAKKDASTWQFGGESNTLTGLYFRGYQLDARQFSVNGLAGMYGTQGTASVHVGSAQLIKGASTAVNGMDPEGAVSGALNIETKKAADNGNRKIGLAWFSKNRVQGTLDLGQRFGEDKQFGIRANAKLRHGDSPREGYDEDNKEFALNADYRGEKLRIAADSVYAKRKTHGGRARLQDIQNADGRLFDAPNGKVNLTTPWNWQNTVGQTNMLTFEYDTDYSFQITGGIGYNKANYYGTMVSPTICGNKGAAGMYRTCDSADQYHTGTARLTDQYFRTLSMNLSARGEFATGPVTHNWSTAFDRINRKRETYRGTAAGKNKIAVYPNRGDIAGQLAAFQPDYPNTLERTPNLDAVIKVNSLALSDTLGFADNKYRLTLGGRFQAVEYTDRKAGQKGDSKRFSPMFMAAWVPSPDLVVYGNYMEDLEPADIKDDGTGETTMAKPRVSRQFEVGVRKNWGDFVTTLNAFQIKRPGYWRGANTKINGKDTDFAAHKARGGAAGDEQGVERNRGIEFNVYANLLNKTLRPNLGITYLKSTVKNYPGSLDNLINGVQVSNPNVIAKAGVEWDTPFAKGLTLHTEVQHFGKSYQDTQKKYAFPSYTLVDAGARYKAKLGGKNTLTVSGTVENLFNKKYWQVQRGQYDRSFAVVGMPRTFWLKAELEF